MKITNTFGKKIQRKNSKGQFRGGSEAITNITFVPFSHEMGLEDSLEIDNLLAGGTMIVEFNQRGTYEYYGVQYPDYLRFKDAPSWGTYFNDFIRPYFLDYSRID